MSSPGLPAQPAPSSEDWDALLWVSSTVWKKRRSGLLPDPGEQIVLHEELPPVQVVSVVEQRGDSVCAALLRLPEERLLDGQPAEEWSRVLWQEGWTPQW